MIRQKTKKDYLVPHVKVAEADLEGLICTSGFKTMMVDEHKSLSYENCDSEQLYFEF